jgi:hypothetical protein
LAVKDQNNRRPKIGNFNFLKIKRKFVLKKCKYSCSQSNFAFLTIFFQLKKKNFRITYFEIGLFFKNFFFVLSIFSSDFPRKKLSSLLLCFKFRSNLHQYHMFLKKMFYYEKDIQYRFFWPFTANLEHKFDIPRTPIICLPQVGYL